MIRHRKSEGRVEPTLPVTPMLDMAFQLLAFFVMTYHPSDLEGQMDLRLMAQNATAERGEPAPVVPEQNRIELPTNLTVIVRTRADDGHISALALRDDAGPSAVDNLEQLTAELRKRRAAEPSGDIAIQADGKLKWQAVVEVMDVCRQAGYPNIRFAAPPDFAAAR